MYDGEISVVNDDNVTGWLAAATRVGEVYMTDVKSMVTNVLGKAAGRPIKRLNVLDHGNEDGGDFGSDWVDTTTFKKFEPFFVLLRGHFAPEGFVHLQHCDIGQNTTLLIMFAKAFGVPVIGGTGAQNPIGS
jgi:hypothetical protein